MSAPIIFLPVIPVQHHQEPVHGPAATSPSPTTRAEHDRAKLLDVHAFGVAERAAEGRRQSDFAAAAAELKAAGVPSADAYDRHNEATHAAERQYLETVIAAADQYGVASRGWKQTLQTLPKPKSAAEWAAGKGKW
jgi:hypothetical protein